MSGVLTPERHAAVTNHYSLYDCGIGMLPAYAQDDEMVAAPIMILPVDQAQFLQSAMFDMRVEVHAEAMPEDFAVTINGEPAADVRLF